MEKGPIYFSKAKKNKAWIIGKLEKRDIEYKNSGLNGRL